MDSLQPVSQAVAAGLGAKRVGTPVSVRIVAHTTDDHGRIEGVLGRLLEMASQWLGAQAKSSDLDHHLFVGGIATDGVDITA